MTRTRRSRGSSDGEGIIGCLALVLVVWGVATLLRGCVPQERVQTTWQTRHGVKVPMTVRRRETADEFFTRQIRNTGSLIYWWIVPTGLLTIPIGFLLRLGGLNTRPGCLAVLFPGLAIGIVIGSFGRWLFEVARGPILIKRGSASDVEVTP